jgi:hypothetical protein
MPFVDSTSGRDPSINEVQPVRAPWRRLQKRIEERADVHISVTSFDDEEFGKGTCAIASKATHHAYAGGMTSRTVASVWADGPFLALDKLAAKLGVSVEADDELADNHANVKERAA